MEAQKKTEWIRLKEKQPEKDGLYIVCDSYGHITLKLWHTFKPNTFGNDTNQERGAFLKQRNYQYRKYADVVANNVYYWMPLPPLPDTKTVEIEALQRRIAELKAQIKELTQGESNTMEGNE